jgi:hypothetical protein
VFPVVDQARKLAGSAPYLRFSGSTQSDSYEGVVFAYRQSSDATALLTKLRDDGVPSKQSWTVDGHWVAVTSTFVGRDRRAIDSCLRQADRILF